MSALSKSHKGKNSEEKAVTFLINKGYKILKQNFRSPQGEIDIIAWEGDVLCFIEVRSRQSTEYGHPFESISTTKQRRITKVAQHFLNTHPHIDYEECRFDVVGIVLKPKEEIQLIRGAFEGFSVW